MAKLDRAATARFEAAERIAARLGYESQGAAFRAMGQDFVAIVKKEAPSITEAMEAMKA